MADEILSIDANYKGVDAGVGESSGDIIVLRLDDVTKRLLVDAVIGSEYTEGDTDTTISGVAMLMEGASDTLLPIQGTVADGLLVNLGTNNDVTIGGSVAVTNAGLTELAAAINASSQMDVNLAASVVDVALGTDISNVFGAASLVSATPALKVEQQGAVAVTGTFWQTTQPVSATDLDIRDLTHVSDSVKIGDGTDLADVLDLTNANPLAVAILDGNGTQITSFGGGTQYTEGDTDATITGTAMMMEGAANVLVAAPGTVADGLLVNLGTNNDITLATLPDTAAGDLAAIETNTDGIETVLGTIDTDTGNIVTSVQLIDDVIYTDDDDWTDTTSKHALVGGVYQSVPQSITDGDVGPLEVNKLGSLRTAIPEDDLATAATTHVKKYYTSAGAVTDGIIWSPAAGKRWYVTDIFINVSAAATVTLEDDLAAGDSAIWKAELAANSGWSHSFKTPWYSGEDASDLIVTTTTGNVYISVVGYEI